MIRKIRLSKRRRGGTRGEEFGFKGDHYDMGREGKGKSHSEHRGSDER